MTDTYQQKLDAFFRAIEQAGIADDAMDELRAASDEVMMLHPGIGQEEWGRLLCEQYGTEVVDAFGHDTESITRGLDKLWHKLHPKST